MPSFMGKSASPPRAPSPPAPAPSAAHLSHSVSAPQLGFQLAPPGAVLPPLPAGGPPAPPGGLPAGAGLGALASLQAQQAAYLAYLSHGLTAGAAATPFPPPLVLGGHSAGDASATLRSMLNIPHWGGVAGAATPSSQAYTLAAAPPPPSLPPQQQQQLRVSSAADKSAALRSMLGVLG
jgi:hypothetical protein